MSLCLILGHDPARMPGAGAYEGQLFDVCQRCGATTPAPVAEPHDPPSRAWRTGSEVFVEGEV